MSSPPTETDVLVVGAGPGGYVAAIRAGQLGLDVTLVDADAFGGVCLNYGCIPSKALLSAADVVHDAGHRESMGIYADPYVDWDELLEWQAGVVARLTDGVKALCRGAGVDLVDGHARFVDEHSATVTTPDGTDNDLAFDRAVVATGSRAVELETFPFDEEAVLTSRDVFSMADVPRRLVVVGAGYIGLELATLFAKLGTEVRVVEFEDDVLPGWDDELRGLLREHLESLGVEFAFGQRATGCTVGSSGVVVSTAAEDGTETDHEADRVVVAVGRQPVTDTAGLEHLGVETTERGFVDVDERCRTSLDHVFAIGDVAGEPMLAHKASAEGHVAAEVLAGQDASMANRTIPAVIFTDPEVATVGLSETDADDAGYSPVVGEMPFGANGRALTADSQEGFVRVVVDAESDAILGAQVVGADASELVGELCVAIQAGLSPAAVSATVHPHPTLSEAVMEACADALDEAIHTS
nr:dihydrolipoyl dehydrogenase [Halomarina salina]